MLLFKDCGNRPFCCLRFNPDKYTKQNNEKQEGCFDWEKFVNSSGHPDLRMIVNQEELERRMAIVIYHLRCMIEEGTSKEVDVLYLFYDGYD